MTSPVLPTITVPMTPPQARLATWKEVQRNQWKKPLDAPKTIWNAIRHHQATDYDLARLDDTMRTTAVALIAGLGSLGVRQTGGAIPLVLGAFSWLAAMNITPKIINAMVYLKTGVNLNTHYMSSHGKMHRLTEDINYMPVQVLPLEKRIALAERLGIPREHPDRPALLLTQIKQIAVQAHTWWMLMAGMATPLLASLICDTVEGPSQALVGRFRVLFAQQQVQKALQAQNTSALEKAFVHVFETTMGAGNEVTPMSRWWKQLGPDLVKTLQLNTLPEHVMLSEIPEKRFEQMVAVMSKSLQDPAVRSQLQTLIQHKRQGLNEVLTPLSQLLHHPKIRQETARTAYPLMKQKLALARETAESTLSHLSDLIRLAEKLGSTTGFAKRLAQKMQQPTLPYLIQVYQEGDIGRAMKIAGGAKRYHRVMEVFNNGKFRPAYDMMGASPKDFLEKALKSIGARQRWFRRFPLTVGVGLIIVPTLIFMTCFLGKNFHAADKESVL